VKTALPEQNLALKISGRGLRVPPCRWSDNERSSETENKPCPGCCSWFLPVRRVGPAVPAGGPNRNSRSGVKKAISMWQTCHPWSLQSTTVFLRSRSGGTIELPAMIPVWSTPGLLWPQLPKWWNWH